MKWTETTIEKAMNGGVSATFHFHEDKKVWLVPDEQKDIPVENLRAILNDMLSWYNGFSQRIDITNKQVQDYINFRHLDESEPNSNQQGDGWIRVEDGLPEKNGYYTCYCCDPKEFGLIHYHKDTGWQNGFYNDRVTHFKKLEPPIQ